MTPQGTPNDTRDFAQEGQLLSAVVGAVVGSLIGGVIALLTGRDPLWYETAPSTFTPNVSFLWHFMVVVPFAATGVGLIAAWAWNNAVKWATRLGSPFQELRERGQHLNLALAGLVSVAAGLFFMLVAPWLAGWTVVLLLAISFVEPIQEVIKWVWETVK